MKTFQIPVSEALRIKWVWMKTRESPVPYSKNGDISSWICSLVLHSRCKEKYRKNESALKSAPLRISVDKRGVWKNQKILSWKVEKNSRDKLSRIAVFKFSRHKLSRKNLKLAKFAKVCLAKVSMIKVINWKNSGLLQKISVENIKNN